MKRDIDEQYERLEKAGGGSWGVVYLARNRENNKRVAIKRLIRRNNDGHWAQVAKREEHILRACQASPHVIQLEEVLEGAAVAANGEGSVFLVMEQAQHDLRGLMENTDISGRWTRAHVKGYCWQLLCAVAFIHARGFMHRDLKPANVLISHDNVLKLADFGMATSLVDGDDPLERHGHLMNPVATMWYRAPEVILGARDYGAAIDVWAVGCIIGDLLQNLVFLPGKSDEEQLECIYALCGTPLENGWPEAATLPKWKVPPTVTVRDFQRSLVRENRLVARKRFFTQQAVSLLDGLLMLRPGSRLGAAEALQHAYFDATQDGGIEVLAAKDMIRYNDKSHFAAAK